jgi:hypothetical protein
LRLLRRREEAVMVVVWCSDGHVVVGDREGVVRTTLLT